MKNAATKEKFIEMRAEGISYTNISKELGVCKQTLIAWGKTFETDIQNFKAIRMDEIFEKFALTKEGRIKLIGELLEKIREEILKRDMKDLPTDKLFELIPKLSQLIENENRPLKFFAHNEFQEHQSSWTV